MRQVQKPRDFEKFYYRYVGKGEACGCAERIIDIDEFNRLAGPRSKSLGPKRTLLSKLWARIKRTA